MNLSLLLHNSILNPSLDDDCLLSPEAKAVFLERIIHSFGLGQNDKKIRVLKKELKELLCHNTDLRGKTAWAKRS